MTANGILQIVLYIVVLIALAKPLGGYMARVYQHKRIALERILGPIERLLYRAAAGIRLTDEMGWKSYTILNLALDGT